MGWETAIGDPMLVEEELAKRNIWHDAKLRGVAFRAIGQEPGWVLEITDGEQILLVTDYGRNRHAYPYVEPRQDEAARVTVFQVNQNTSVLVEGKPCTDSMSGDVFETTVTITHGSRMLRGCGRALY